MQHMNQPHGGGDQLDGWHFSTDGGFHIGLFRFADGNFLRFADGNFFAIRSFGLFNSLKA